MSKSWDLKARVQVPGQVGVLVMQVTRDRINLGGVGVGRRAPRRRHELMPEPRELGSTKHACGVPSMHGEYQASDCKRQYSIVTSTVQSPSQHSHSTVAQSQSQHSHSTVTEGESGPTSDGKHQSARDRQCMGTKQQELRLIRGVGGGDVITVPPRDTSRNGMPRLDWQQ